MGKRKQLAKLGLTTPVSDRPAPAQLVARRPEISVESRGFAWPQALEAARRQPGRTMFWFPDLDADSRYNARTREEIYRNNTWLYDNLAPVRMVIDGLSLDEVDTGTWPKATTSSEAFNKAVTDDFHEINKDPRFFSASGQENYYSAQWLIRRTIALYGGLFGQFLRPGDGISLPTMHFVQPWQCGNKSNEPADSRWEDGFLKNARNRVLFYKFLTNPERTAANEIPADDVLYFHDQLWTGQSRTTGILTPCTRGLYSFDDIERSETGSLLRRAKLAYTITRREGDDGGPVIPPEASAVETIDTGDGGKLTIAKLAESQPDEVTIADIPAGFDMKVLESNRAVLTIDFLKWILSGVAAATLYPAEYVFNLAGLGQGTLVRLVQKRVQRVKNTRRQFQLIPQFCDRWYVFWVWQRILAGVYDGVEGGIPKDWWKHKTICPADDTVDLGREGALLDDRLDSGKISPEAYHGAGGEDASDVEDEVIAAAIRRARKLQDAKKANPELAELIGNPFTESKAPVVVPAETPPPAGKPG